MLKTLFAGLFIFSAIHAENVNDFLQVNKEAFKNTHVPFEREKKEFNVEYKEYQKILYEEVIKFRKKLKVYWYQAQLSTKTQWVDYSTDLQQRKIVDFEKDTITLDVHAHHKIQAIKLLRNSLVDSISKNAQQAFDSDILCQNIERRLSNPEKHLAPTEPILSAFIFNAKVTRKDIYTYARKKVRSKKVQINASKMDKLKRYSITVKLPKSILLKKLRPYLAQVKKMSKEFDIPVSLILAVIQTESSFNPMAQSPIPAFGLMQIVPQRAGLDVYYYLYKKHRILSPAYLYNAHNNIKLGTAYLRLLDSKYLKNIRNPTSRLYCTIAAYNTGAGNVSKTFIGKNNNAEAATIINIMSPAQVYTYLVKHLKFKESSNYLAKVVKRNAFFSKLHL